MKKTLFTSLVFILALSSLGFVKAGASDPRIVCVINDLRIKNKLPAFVEDPRLTASAETHAKALAKEEGPLSYISNKTNPAQRLEKFNFTWTAIAELLSNEGFPLTQLFNDPDHKRTLLSPDLDSVGVALVQSSKGVPYVVIDMAKGPGPAKGKPPNCANVPYNNESRLKLLTNYAAQLLQKFGKVRTVNKNITELSEFRVQQFLGSLQSKNFFSETEFVKRAAEKGLELGSFAKFESCASMDVVKLLRDLARFSRLVPKKLDQVGLSVDGSKHGNAICICAIFAPKTVPSSSTPSEKNENEKLKAGGKKLEKEENAREKKADNKKMKKKDAEEEEEDDEEEDDDDDDEEEEDDEDDEDDEEEDEEDDDDDDDSEDEG